MFPFDHRPRKILVPFMAKFTNLPNELIVAIASHIQKPIDILHLCIAERRSHAIIQPLLYDNTILHHLDYPTHQQHSLNTNITSLCRLLRQRQQNSKCGNGHSPDPGEECRSLAIHMHNSMGFPTTNVLELFSFLPFFWRISASSAVAANLITGKDPPSMRAKWDRRCILCVTRLRPWRCSSVAGKETVANRELVACTASKRRHSYGSKAMSSLGETNPEIATQTRGRYSANCFLRPWKISRSIAVKSTWNMEKRRWPIASRHRSKSLLDPSDRPSASWVEIDASLRARSCACCKSQGPPTLHMLLLLDRQAWKAASTSLGGGQIRLMKTDTEFSNRWLSRGTRAIWTEAESKKDSYTSEGF